MLALGCREQGNYTYKDRRIVTGMAGFMGIGSEFSNISKAMVNRNQELKTLNQIEDTLAASTFDID